MIGRTLGVQQKHDTFANFKGNYLALDHNLAGPNEWYHPWKLNQLQVAYEKHMQYVLSLKSIF